MFDDAIRHHRAGQLTAAERLYRQILAVDSHHADSLHFLGLIACQTGRLEAAIALIRQAITINPSKASYHSNFGIALKSQGNLNVASAYFRRALDLDPRLPEIRYNLGTTLQALGRLDEAITRFEETLALKPAYPEALTNLAAALQARGRLNEAVIRYRQALVLKPALWEAHNNLGNALQELGRSGEAAVSFRRAVDLNPDDPDTRNILGITLRRQGRLVEAADCFHRAIDLKPDLAEGYNNLGNVLQEQERLDQAVACFRAALALKPGDAEFQNNLGSAFQFQGKLDQALACYRRAYAIRPEFADAYSNALFMLQFSARYSSLDILSEARRFGAQLQQSGPATRHHNRPDPDRRLRIGYVSADLRAHPVGYFLAGVLPPHQTSNVEAICYSNSPVVDAMTRRLRDSVAGWRSIAGVADAEAARMIAQDGIDVLVDLSGHMAGNRLSLFALRPAPVQATWLGYSGTTGLSTIDYILADRFVVPPGDEAYFTEKVWRLPDCYLCYSPYLRDIPMGPFPALTSGGVTFGSFNIRPKLTPETIAAWAAILKRVEGSQLFLKTRSLNDAGCRAMLLAEFTRHGVTAERLIFEGHSPQAELLAAYNRVDIALDPFPFGGTTTTAEALWMGVPLVTLAWPRWVGRVGQSILATLDLTDWVADDIDGYVETACRLAMDLPNLARLRSDLRRRLECSPFCDGPRFARSLEAAYRGMWKEWCDTRSAETTDALMPHPPG